RRQKTLAVVLENVDDPHNIGAILRSCDAFGVQDVHLLYTKKHPPSISRIRSESAASVGSAKWLRLTRWNSTEKLIRELKRKKWKIAVTDLSHKGIDLIKADFSQSVAVVIGNEHGGISKELAKAADMNIRIPMIGFVQSFNVSVAAAIILYEIFRQREKAGFEKSAYSPAEQKAILKSWS
ncbi:MAG TPA: RNA methyltransferase, partial [Patescibacteria group bacterium]|nr:RNA methyltransferase [Patescibacteria group bacterium]